MNPPRPYAVRCKVDPADVRPEIAARRLGLTIADFLDKLPRLLERGFPPADPDTGNYDLEAIDLGRHARHPRLYGVTPMITGQPPAISMEDKFNAAKERLRHGRAS